MKDKTTINITYNNCNFGKEPKSSKKKNNWVWVMIPAVISNLDKLTTLFKPICKTLVEWFIKLQ